jgi:hypothetical protein
LLVVPKPGGNHHDGDVLQVFASKAVSTALRSPVVVLTEALGAQGSGHYRRYLVAVTGGQPLNPRDTLGVERLHAQSQNLFA